MAVAPTSDGILPRRHRVAALAFDGMSPFELGIVAEVFGLPRPELGADAYELVVCSVDPGPLRAVGGMTVAAGRGLDAFGEADTVIVPGVADVRAPVDRRLCAALVMAHRRGARVVAICSGAFALAAAGLLDGRRATTHWRYAALLQQRYPRVQVDAGVLYVDEGRVLTSAGSAAGLDLCLHLVRRDLGAAAANTVARRLVVPPHRDGGQAQFVEAPVPDDPGDDRIAESMAWAVANLTAPLTVAVLARQAHMAPRTYARHFGRATRTTPIAWLIDQRVQAALRLLETTTLPVDQVAAAVGFDSPVTFRHHLRGTVGVSPTAYRRTFAATADARRADLPSGATGAR